MAYGLLNKETEEEVRNFLRDHLKVNVVKLHDAYDHYIKVELLLDNEVISSDRAELPIDPDVASVDGL